MCDITYKKMYTTFNFLSVTDMKIYFTNTQHLWNFPLIDLIVVFPIDDDLEDHEFANDVNVTETEV